jgi:hypothetical protein
MSTHLKASRRSRPMVQVPAGLEKSLSAYAGAAVAAGVSLLALAPSAEAKIVYTPANITIPINGGPVFLNLNHDGIADFSFSQTLKSTADSIRLRVGGKNPRNQVWGRGILGISNRFSVFASALRRGFKVQANKSYFQKAPGWVMFSAGYSFYGSGAYGQWLNTQHRFLGLKFTVGGQIHYGWARFTVAGQTSTLTGYAYETVPNQPIIAGQTKGPDVVTLEPATLGRLSQGAYAIPTWRIKRSTATTH